MTENLYEFPGLGPLLKVTTQHLTVKGQQTIIFTCLDLV